MTMTDEQKQADLDTLTHKIADALGDQWDARPDKHDRLRVFHASAPVYLTVTTAWRQKPGTVKVNGYTSILKDGPNSQGYYPDDLRHVDGYKPMNLGANISTSKTPERIAADIVRRIVGDLHLLGRLAEKRHAEVTEYENARTDQMIRTAAALGGTVGKRYHNGGDPVIDMPRGSYHARYEHTSRTSVCVKLDLSADEWEKLGPILRPMIQRERM